MPSPTRGRRREATTSRLQATRNNPRRRSLSPDTTPPKTSYLELGPSSGFLHPEVSGCEDVGLQGVGGWTHSGEMFTARVLQLPERCSSMPPPATEPRTLNPCLVNGRPLPDSIAGSKPPTLLSENSWASLQSTGAVGDPKTLKPQEPAQPKPPLRNLWGGHRGRRTSCCQGVGFRV